MSKIIKVSAKPLTLNRANKIIANLVDILDDLDFNTEECINCGWIGHESDEWKKCITCKYEICESCCYKANPEKRKDVKYQCSKCSENSESEED